MTYYPFFHIRLGHDFFADGICTAIQLEPTSASAARMQHHRFRAVKRAFGYEIFYQANTPDQLLEDLPTEGLELRFRMLVSDPNFFNYSDLEIVDLQGHIYHSKWQVATDQFAFNQVVDAMVEFANPEAEPSAENDHPVFLTDGIKRSDFGLLSINFSADANTTEDWFDATNIPVLDLAFSSRKTRWRYFLIPSAEGFDAASATILTGTEQSGQSLFVRSEQDTLLPDGNEAITLVSGPRALREKYPTHFTLKIDRSENGTTMPISLSLPNPSPNRINAEKPSTPREEITEFYSDQYIYL